jgi:transposase-like protein
MTYKTRNIFDINGALQTLREGKDLGGKDVFLTPLIKQLTEAAMKAELEAHIEQDDLSNRKNGSSTKTMKSASGEFELTTPRDQSDTFHPQVIKNHPTSPMS